MADAKVSALASATTPLAGTDSFYVIQSGLSKKVPVNGLLAIGTGSETLPVSLGGASNAVNVSATAGGSLGFHGVTAVTIQTITGSRASGAALADLLTKLATLGLIIDGTSA